MKSASREICWTQQELPHEHLTRKVFLAANNGAKRRDHRLTWHKTEDSLCSNPSTKQADNRQRWRRLAATTEPQGRRTEGPQTCSLLAMLWQWLTWKGGHMPNGRLYYHYYSYIESWNCTRQCIVSMYYVTFYIICTFGKYIQSYTICTCVSHIIGWVGSMYNVCSWAEWKHTKVRI